MSFIDINIETIKLRVTWSWIPAQQGKRDSYGVLLEPDSEAHFELEGAYVLDSKVNLLDILNLETIVRIKSEIADYLNTLDEVLADEEYTRRHEQGLD